LVFALYLGVAEVWSVQVGHDRLDWSFWVSMAASLGLLTIYISSFARHLRSGGRLRLMTAQVISDPAGSPGRQ
jgi:hypothetical protein